MSGKDFYQILGLKRDASQKEIKLAYRKLARKYHPDVSTVKNAEEKFKAMGEAYETLKNERARDSYDRQNSSGNQQSQQYTHQNTHQENSQPKYKQKRSRNAKPSGKRQTNKQRNTYGFNETSYNESHANDLNSFFSDQFGVAQKGNDKNSFKVEGKDSYARVMIDLEDSLNGASRQFTVETTITSPQGELINKNKTLHVNIPKGIQAGETIHLVKQGSPGMGAAAGDFLLEVAFNNHHLYKIEGNNLYVNLPVTSSELELGAKIRISSPNKRLGKITVNISKKSHHADQIRYQGHGIPSRNPGDLIVVLQETFSSSNDQNAKPAYDQSQNGFTPYS